MDIIIHMGVFLGNKTGFIKSYMDKMDLATWIHSAYFTLDFMDKVLTST